MKPAPLFVYVLTQDGETYINIDQIAGVHATGENQCALSTVAGTSIVVYAAAHLLMRAVRRARAAQIDVRIDGANIEEIEPCFK